MSPPTGDQARLEALAAEHLKSKSHETTEALAEEMFRLGLHEFTTTGGVRLAPKYRVIKAWGGNLSKEHVQRLLEAGVEPGGEYKTKLSIEMVK